MRWPRVPSAWMKTLAKRGAGKEEEEGSHHPPCKPSIPLSLLLRLSVTSRVSRGEVTGLHQLDNQPPPWRVTASSRLLLTSTRLYPATRHEYHNQRYLSSLLQCPTVIRTAWPCVKPSDSRDGPGWRHIRLSFSFPLPLSFVPPFEIST